MSRLFSLFNLSTYAFFFVISCRLAKDCLGSTSFVGTSFFRLCSRSFLVTMLSSSCCRAMALMDYDLAKTYCLRLAFSACRALFYCFREEMVFRDSVLSPFILLKHSYIPTFYISSWLIENQLRRQAETIVLCYSQQEMKLLRPLNMASHLLVLFLLRISVSQFFRTFLGIFLQIWSRHSTMRSLKLSYYLTFFLMLLFRLHIFSVASSSFSTMSLCSLADYLSSYSFISFNLSIIILLSVFVLARVQIYDDFAVRSFQYSLFSYYSLETCCFRYQASSNEPNSVELDMRWLTLCYSFTMLFSISTSFLNLYSYYSTIDFSLCSWATFAYASMAFLSECALISLSLSMLCARVWFYLMRRYCQAIWLLNCPSLIRMLTSYFYSFSLLDFREWTLFSSQPMRNLYCLCLAQEIS